VRAQKAPLSGKENSEGLPHHHLSIYDGADRIGTVIERDGCCYAFDINGVHLGEFKKRKHAADAVSLSAVSSCVADTNACRDNS
jgi:hypothetical protein